MGVAGIFYALAAFGAIRDALLGSAGLRPATAMVFAVLLGALATGWAVRAAGVHYVLRSQAFKHQIDWIELQGRWERANQWPDDPARQGLIRQLRDDAVQLALPNTRFGRPDWPNRLWLE